MKLTSLVLTCLLGLARLDAAAAKEVEGGRLHLVDDHDRREVGLVLGDRARPVRCLDGEAAALVLVAAILHLHSQRLDRRAEVADRGGQLLRRL